MELEPFRLERFFDEHEFSAPYLLCSSDCESMTLGELLAYETDAQQKFASLWLGYTETLGDPELRKQIATHYKQATANQILVHAGAEEAIFNFMHAVLGPGDQVIVHTPCYQSLAEVARSAGALVDEWRGDPQQGWGPDIDELKPMLSHRTKALVINFPHNPTGFLPPLEFVTELSALSDRYGFVIFSDEVYRGLEFDPADRLPAMTDLNSRAVSLGVMSKTYGLAGLRIGWIATRDAAIFKKLAAFKDYTTICNSAPSEFLSTLALRHKERIAERNLRIIRDNLDRLDEFFDVHTRWFNWQQPRAGSIAFPQLIGGSVDQFCSDLRERTGVLLAPGTLFGPQYNAFRIGFGRKNMPEALERFDAFLRQYGD